MTEKILELTQKIYSEGVEKAQEEANQIIANAKIEADDIINAAKNEDKHIVQQAKKQADELKINTDAEIRLASRQFISKLKHEISQIIIAKQVEEPVKKAFKDEGFIKSIIMTIINNWNPQKPEELNINLLLPQKDENELREYFNNRAVEMLNKGVEIKFAPDVEDGFMIKPTDGSYYLSFTDKDFENYFKNYLKDKTKKIIFD